MNQSSGDARIGARYLSDSLKKTRTNRRGYRAWKVGVRTTGTRLQGSKTEGEEGEEGVGMEGVG